MGSAVNAIAELIISPLSKAAAMMSRLLPPAERICFQSGKAAVGELRWRKAILGLTDRQQKAFGEHTDLQRPATQG